MLTPDSQLILNIIMIELFGTIFLLLAVTIFIYAKRCFARKSLAGCKVLVRFTFSEMCLNHQWCGLLKIHVESDKNYAFHRCLLLSASHTSKRKYHSTSPHLSLPFWFQITNGGSAFSIELAELLATQHGCQSILLETHAKHTANSFKRTSNGISTINCNPLDNADLAQLGESLEREYGGNIDVIIDNGISNISKEIRQNCGTFVDYTSERLRVTINVRYDFSIHN